MLGKFPALISTLIVPQIRITCPGSPGHGSMFLGNTAGEKAQFMINKLLAYRQQEKARLEADPTKTLGDVTTVNLTIMEGGVQTNVVPDKYFLISGKLMF